MAARPHGSPLCKLEQPRGCPDFYQRYSYTVPEHKEYEDSFIAPSPYPLHPLLKHR